MHHSGSSPESIGKKSECSMYKVSTPIPDTRLKFGRQGERLHLILLIKNGDFDLSHSEIHRYLLNRNTAQCVLCTVGFPWSKNSPGDATKLPSIRHRFWGIICISPGE